MKNRKKNIEEMIRKIEARGGHVGFAEQTPPEILEVFLREVLECEECGGHSPGRSGERSH